MPIFTLIVTPGSNLMKTVFDNWFEDAFGELSLSSSTNLYIILSLIQFVAMEFFKNMKKDLLDKLAQAFSGVLDAASGIGDGNVLPNSTLGRLLIIPIF